MTENGEINIALQQHYECVLLFVPWDYKLFLIFSYGY